jgi:hypothetical protein
MTALSLVATPDRIKRSDIKIGSPEWYADIAISPTLELLWSGASDAANIANSANIVAVAVDRQRAFVVLAQSEIQGDLLIFDVSDPAVPIQRTSLPLPKEDNVRIRLADGLALIAAGQTLQIVDVRDADHPALRGSVEAPARILGLSVASDRAYVTTQGSNTGALSIFDIGDSTHPTLLGSITTLGPAPRDIQVIGNLAYVADTSRLLIADVSNPGAPKQIGSYQLSSQVAQAILGAKDVLLSAESIQVIGPRAYLGTNLGLVILDLSNPAKPAVLGSYAHAEPYSISDIKVTADRAYMTFANWGSSDYGGMDVVDISDPARPRLVGGYITGASNAYEVEVLDRLIYVANGRRGFLILRFQSE